MPLKITNIKKELAQTESDLAVLNKKVDKVSKTVRNYKIKRDKLIEKRDHLRAVKVQAEKFNAIEVIV